MICRLPGLKVARVRVTGADQRLHPLVEITVLTMRVRFEGGGFPFFSLEVRMLFVVLLFLTIPDYSSNLKVDFAVL